MSIERRAVALLLALVAVVLVAPGCGDDEENDVTVPSISVPDGSSQSVPEETTTAPSTAPSGGTGTADPGKEDSPGNDLPPPPGSPQEAFEQACKKNPAACG